MSFANPLPTADFWDLLRISQVSFSDFEPQQIDQTASGTVLKASVGDALWRGSVQTYIDPDRPRALKTEARLSMAKRPGMAFLCYDPRQTHPANDPDGSKLGAADVTVWTVLSNSRLRLQGLPQGYKITAGDLIGFTYGSNPTRYSLHRVQVDRFANNDGAPNLYGTPILDVTPFLPIEIVPDVAVTLIKPVIKAVVTQEQFGEGQPGYIGGPSFSFTQTFR